MKTSLLLGSMLVGATALWAMPALAEDAPTQVVVQPTQPAPAPAPAPTTVVVAKSDTADTRPRAYPGLIWGGVAVWGVSYGIAATSAAVASDVCSASDGLCVKGREVLYIPVVGPFAAMAGVEGRGTATLRAMLAINGAFQLGGVAMAVSGIVLSASNRPAPRTVVARKVAIAPFATPTSAGIGTVGRF
jgi:hypothetical protein